MIVDAHAHVFKRVHGRVGRGPVRPLGFGRVSVGPSEEIQVMPPLNSRVEYTTEMQLAAMNWAGIDKAVLLQGPFYGEANDYVAAAVRSAPGRFVGAAYADPWVANAKDRLESFLDTAIFGAVKLECSVATGLFGVHAKAALDRSLEWLWDEVERRGLVLVLDLGAIGSRSYRTESVREIKENRPSLKIVIAHLGQPSAASQSDSQLRDLWWKQVRLAELPNVWFDTASVVTYFDETFPFPAAGRHIRAVIEAVGAHKVLWGTDVPALLATATYPQLLLAAQMHTEFLSAADQALVLGGNAVHVFFHRTMSDNRA